jgi:hypothetical protein
MGLQILYELVIYVDDGIISHQIVLPLLEIFNHGIEFFSIGRVVENFPIKYFILIEDEPSSLHQYFSHGIPT